jgi:hypothetical protein
MDRGAVRVTTSEFLGRLNRVRKGGTDGHYTAECPGHQDSKNSLGIREGDDGRTVLFCFAGCSAEKIVAALGLTMADLFRSRANGAGGGRHVITLQEFAAAKQLPAAFLSDCGVVEQRGALQITYRHRDGTPAARQRRRTAIAAKDGSWWTGPKDTSPIAYGAWRLDDALEKGELLLVEGESDSLTAWYHNIPALGIPGAALTKTLEAEHVAGIPRLFVLREPDDGGSTFIARMSLRLAELGWTGEARVLSLPVKDLNELHISAGAAFAEQFARARDAAVPLMVNQLGSAATHAQPAAPQAAPAPVAPNAPLRLPGGFIGRYVEAALQRTDAPAEAHALTAVGVLSALAGPRVRLPLAYRSDGVRLGIWTMNVVDSTSGRKSTVLEFGIDVLRQVLGELAILPWKGSPEALIQALAVRDGSSAVFARDEYSGLLAQMKRGGYVAGLAQDFIRAYDGLPIVMARTAKMNRKSGERVDDTDRVREPYLVKLCAATRTAFIETATIEDVLDGLLARFVFTSGSAEERRAQPMTRAIEDAWRAVVDLAREFHDRAGELLSVTLPDAVLDQAWELERRYRAAALEHPRPDAARPAMKRLAETVLKVAALLAIDRARDGSAIITPEDFEAAVALGECWQATTLALIADIGRSRFQARADKVLATIRAHPKGIMLSALYRAHRDLQGREFDDVLDALERQRLVHSVEVKVPGKAGRPPVMYFPGPPADEA